jgi:competence protein ComEC
MKPTAIITNIFASERLNFIFYAILLFVLGCAFGVYFEKNCEYFLQFFVIIFGFLILVLSLDYKSSRAVFYLTLIIFILGIFYSKFYIKYFAKNEIFTQKIYIKGEGKIIDLKEFYNPVNRNFGINILLENLTINKLGFQNNKIDKVSDKKVKKLKKKKKKIKKKSKKSTEKKLKKTAKKISKTQIKKQQAFAKKIYKNYINLRNYQEVDRRFLDFKKNNYSQNWIAKNNEFILENSPQKISLNLAKQSTKFNINDVIKFNAVLEPLDFPDFKESFDLKLNARTKNIQAFGFFIGKPQIILQNQINSIDSWFLNLREIIRQKILNNLSGDVGNVALALLIGEQKNISKNLLWAIRNSGLSHLLSISGFHLSLASAIFFVSVRWLLVRIEFIALCFDIKKISAIFAIFASYFYLKIADAPLPAQRALIMVWMVMLSLLINRKFDGKRALFLALLLLVLFNPHNLFQISFLLSFLAILTMVCYVETFREKIFPDYNLQLEDKFITGILSKIKLYFCEIFIITTLIQIITLPILMNSFQTFSFVGFFANLVAIPLVGFLIMPLGFLALFLMPISVEILPLFLMKYSLDFFIKAVEFFADFKFAIISTPYLPSLGLILCLISSVIFFIANSKFLKIIILLFFILSFGTIFLHKKNQIIFEKSQKFYGIFYEKNLYFSKKIKPTKQVKSWLKHFEVKNFDVIKKCEKNKNLNPKICQKCYKNYCELHVENQRILVLNGRNKLSKICRKFKAKKFDAIVNMTKKYQIPPCFAKYNNPKIIIDNSDFLLKGTNFLEIKNSKLIYFYNN